MATEKIEIEILAKGKPAEKAIKGVENKTKDLGKTTKKTGKETDGVLAKMKAGWIAVGASVAIAVTKAASFERASIGLTKAQKEWAKETSLATDIQAEQVAGFLKSAQTAGLAEDQMKDLAKQAIALGYAFPHEDAETLHDNLVMLSKTGEAQGFDVDILEQKYVGLGEDITTLDLKTKSWSEKMKLVGEVAAKSQAQMDASKYKGLNEVIGTMDKAFTDVGDTLVALGSDTGGFSLVKRIIEGVSLSIQFIGAGIKTLATDIEILFDKLGIVHDKQVEKIETSKKELTVDEKIAKLLKFRDGLYRELNISTGSHTDAINKQIETINLQIRNLQEYGDAHHDVKEKIKESKDAHKELTREMGVLNDVGKDTAKGIGDYFANMVTGVKTSFKDMVKSILANLVRVRVQALATQAITKASGGSGLLGTIAGFFTKHTGGEVKHTGGMIGVPSFHSGFRSDERMAKLQVGESVVNRAGTARNAQAIDAMNKGYSVGGGGNVTQAEINFNVQAIDAASFNNYLVGNRHTIENIINRSLTTNGTVRQTIKQVV